MRTARAQSQLPTATRCAPRPCISGRPVPRSLHLILLSLLASRRSVGGFVAVQAHEGRLCVECSAGFYPFFGNCLECENKLGARLLQPPAAPPPFNPLQRGRDAGGWLHLHTHSHICKHTHAHSIERARHSSLCAARVPVCRLQRFQQRERCSRVRRLLRRVALLAAGQPDLVRPTFDYGRVRLICALAAFMRQFHRSSSHPVSELFR